MYSLTWAGYALKSARSVKRTTVIVDHPLDCTEHLYKLACLTWTLSWSPFSFLERLIAPAVGSCFCWFSWDLLVGCSSMTQLNSHTTSSGSLSLRHLISTIPVGDMSCHHPLHLGLVDWWHFVIIWYSICFFIAYSPFYAVNATEAGIWSSSLTKWNC